MMIPKGCDQTSMLKAVEMANRVDFLNNEEFTMYACVVYNATMWGKKIDIENKKLKEIRR